MANTILLDYGGTQIGSGNASIYKVERGSKIILRPSSAGYDSTLSGFSSTYFTSTSNVTGRYGDSDSVKYVKSNAPTGTVYIELRNSGRSTVKAHAAIQVVSSMPSLPSTFATTKTFVTSYTNQVANKMIWESKYDINPSIYTMVHVRSDDPNVYFSEYVDPADRFESAYTTKTLSELFIPDRGSDKQYLNIRYLASGTAYTTKTVKVYIGDIVKTVTITTGKEVVPSSHFAIDFGHTSGPLSLNDIRGFFGGTGALSDYRRGYRNVPDIPKNSNIPTALPLKITDYRGAATAFYIARHPYDAYESLNTANSAGSISTSWHIWDQGLNHWDLGFSPFVKDNVEFRYTYTQKKLSGWGNSTPQSVMLWSPSGNAGAWSLANKQVNVTASYSKRSECRTVITVTFWARHKDFPDKVLSTTADFQVTVTGP